MALSLSILRSCTSFLLSFVVNKKTPFLGKDSSDVSSSRSDLEFAASLLGSNASMLADAAPHSTLLLCLAEVDDRGLADRIGDGLTATGQEDIDADLGGDSGWPLLDQVEHIAEGRPAVGPQDLGVQLLQCEFRVLGHTEILGTATDNEVVP